MRNIYKYFIILLVSVSIVACSEEDLDINTSPNNPATSTAQFTLPAAQVAIAGRLGFDYNLLGSVLSQYWTQGPTASQYSFLETYTITTNNYTGAWSTLYAGGLKDLGFVEAISLENGNTNTAAVSMLVTAYTYQMLVDLYDQIPYFEALSGKEGISQPAFDNGDVVYDDLIIKIDEALSMIDLGSPQRPGVEDLIFGGDMTMWIKFANTLKLKIYMRQSEARASVAQAGIQAMYAAGDEFLGLGEDAVVNFSNNTQNEHPLWQNLNQTSFTNLVASETSITALLADADPRIAAYYTVAPNSGSYVGLTQGVGTNSGNVYNDFAALSATNVVTQALPVIFFSSEESLFLQAEAAERGFGIGSAQGLYDQAVSASFAKWGFDASTFIAAAGPYEYAGLESIITQKWMAFNGTQGFEAWNDWRRTGFPISLVTSATSTLPAATYPRRLVFPATEASSNPNVPTLVPITTSVWWDIN